MNTIKKTIVTVLGLAAALAAYSQDYDWAHPKDKPTPSFRIWVETPSNAKVSLKYIPNSSQTMDVVNWGKEENRAFTLHAGSKKFEPDKWNEYSFSFTPRRDGEVTISFVGHWEKQDKDFDLYNLSWIRMANVKMKNAKIQDGTFSNGKKSIKTWTNGKDVKYKDERQAPTIEKDSTAPGGRYLRFNHANGIRQTVKVKKDKEVTISFSAQPDIIIPATH